MLKASNSESASLTIRPKMPRLTDYKWSQLLHCHALYTYRVKNTKDYVWTQQYIIIIKSSWHHCCNAPAIFVRPVNLNMVKSLPKALYNTDILSQHGKIKPFTFIWYHGKIKPFTFIWYCFVFWLGLRRTSTVQVFSCTGGGRPQVPFHALFWAQTGTRVEPPTFHKLAGKPPHIKLDAPMRSRYLGQKCLVRNLFYDIIKLQKCCWWILDLD
jgi:hypothetical protein